MTFGHMKSVLRRFGKIELESGDDYEDVRVMLEQVASLWIVEGRLQLATHALTEMGRLDLEYGYEASDIQNGGAMS